MVGDRCSMLLLLIFFIRISVYVKATRNYESVVCRIYDSAVMTWCVVQHVLSNKKP